MSERKKFQSILDGIREDLDLVEEFQRKLFWNLNFNQGLKSEFSFKKTAFEIIEWIDDVFRDKIYEIDSKIRRFLVDVSLERMYQNVSIQEIDKFMTSIVQEKKGLGGGETSLNLKNLEIAISNYRYRINATMDYVRKFLYETNWANMSKISLEDYVLLKERRKYVNARQELEWVKQAVKSGKYEDVLNHLRTAIDLAIKERFGFKNIQMRNFLRDAPTLNFPLPSYDTIYYYYDEGSNRLHTGKVNTPLECRKAIEFVNDFIDELESYNISQEQIDDFKKKCKWVE